MSRTNLTPEEKRERYRQYYKENREKILARNRERSKRKKSDSKKKWLNESERGRAYREKKRLKLHTEEYRAKRRAAYAAKHANDPMTEHRRRCIEAAKERTSKPIEQRRAEKAAKRDMTDTEFNRSENKSERKQQTVIKYIRQWTKRKVFTVQDLRDGDRMAEADVIAYHKEACKYFELKDRLSNTDPLDYSTRNIIAHRLRVIESHFNEILNKRLSTKSKLKAE